MNAVGMYENRTYQYGIDDFNPFEKRSQVVYYMCVAPTTTGNALMHSIKQDGNCDTAKLFRVTTKSLCGTTESCGGSAKSLRNATKSLCVTTKSFRVTTISFQLILKSQ